MRKKINLVFLLALVLHFSCASLNYVNLNVELPGVATLNLDQFREIVIADFLVEKETKGFDINQELDDFFSAELGQHFKGKITTKAVSWEQKGILQQEDFWKTLLPDPEEVLILTGSVQYSEEIRKAILKEYSGETGEFYPMEKGLAQRKFYTLTLNLCLIEAETGEMLYTRDFKESKGYKNPKQTAKFAFFDLLETVREKFFRNILGEEKLRKRYLISE